MIATRGWSNARVGARSTTYGRPLRPGMREEWRPVRTIVGRAYCRFCGAQVGPCSPGSKQGTRGTQAYLEPDLGLWECTPCRKEGVRADEAREAAVHTGGRE